MNNPYFSCTEYKVSQPRRTLFFFPAGFTKLSLYRPTIRRLNRDGISVIGFDVNWQKTIHELDLEGFKTLMSQVDNVVSDYIQRNKKQPYAIFGTSVGGVTALYLAKRHKEIDAIILNVPHATLSKVLWTHRPSRPFKDTLLSSGITSERQLNELLGDIEPMHGLQLLKHKKIVNFTAMSDTVVTDGLELANALKAANPNAILYRNRFGHFLGGVLGIVSKRKWDITLKD